MKMYRLLNKWLPIIFGCHCRPDRSFYYKGYKFPICARCTGELVGMIIGIPIFIIYNIPIIILLVMMAPMILDGTLQLVGSYESNNTKRVITGVIFGISFINFLMLPARYLTPLAIEIGKNF